MHVHAYGTVGTDELIGAVAKLKSQLELAKASRNLRDDWKKPI